MKFKGAVFDLDGTLIDSMPYWNTLGRDYLLTQGVTPPDDIDRMLKTKSLLEGAEYFQKEFKITKTAQEIIDGITALIQKYYTESIPLKPHVYDFLKRLHNAGVQCCIATANDEALARAALSRLGVLQFFEFIMTCQEAGCGKNSPDVFIRAAEKLGTKIEETIVFEDALHAVQSAKAAGFTVVGVYDVSNGAYRQEIVETADYYLDSFKDWEKIQ